jgi:hypothetical protein
VLDASDISKPDLILKGLITRHKTPDQGIIKKFIKHDKENVFAVEGVLMDARTGKFVVTFSRYEEWTGKGSFRDSAYRIGKDIGKFIASGNSDL